MKENGKKHVTALVVAVIVLVASGALGLITKTFRSYAELVSMIRIRPAMILKIVIIVAFLAALNAVLQIVLGLLQGKNNRISTLSTVFSSLVKYVVVFAGFCWILATIGVNISTIFASIGIVALILGFGAESLVSDIVTGAFILFENQYNVGDVVELDGFRGTVDFIGIRTTGIKDAGGNIKIINNSDIKNIINRSEFGSVTTATIDVAYSVDLKKLNEKIPAMLEKIADEYKDTFANGIKYLGVEELADSGVVLKFKAEVKESDVFSGRRILNLELKNAFDEAGIEIPYSTIDVHMR